MSFLEIPDESDPAVAAMRAAARDALGHVPNYVKLFGLHPEAFQAWRGLVRVVLSEMDERRYELATVAAARQLRSSYCSLAHGKILRDKFHGADEVVKIYTDPATAPIDDVDRAVMDLASKVAADATSVSDEDIARLRSVGLSDREIFEVILAAAMRCFFAKVSDAAGVLPDRAYRDLEPEMQEALTVGRPIEG